MIYKKGLKKCTSLRNTSYVLVQHSVLDLQVNIFHNVSIKSTSYLFATEIPRSLGQSNETDKLINFKH